MPAQLNNNQIHFYLSNAGIYCLYLCLNWNIKRGTITGLDKRLNFGFMSHVKGKIFDNLKKIIKIGDEEKSFIRYQLLWALVYFTLPEATPSFLSFSIPFTNFHLICKYMGIFGQIAKKYGNVDIWVRDIVFVF